MLFRSLPADVVYTLVNYCIGKKEQQFGEGRLPNMREIEKEGYVWARKELFSIEKASEYMKREQALMVKQVLSQNPSYRGGKKAFEYFIRQKIVKAVEAGCGDAEALLRTPKPVKSIYYDFKYYFDEYSYANCDLYVEKAIEDCGNNTLRKEFLRAKGWDAPDDFDINDEEE